MQTRAGAHWLKDIWMADKEKENNLIENGRTGERRVYVREAAASLLIIALVIAVALGVNKFFYGFDHPQLTMAGGSVRENEEAGSGGRERGFVQSEDWRLVLVSSEYPIEEDFDGELTELRYGEKVDSRIYPDLQDMFDEMREAGLSPRVVEGYRTGDEQQKRLSDKIAEYMGYGKSREEARKLALQWEQEPGTSEHEIGICVDISSEAGDNASANDVWNWMDENCSRFGFIKRYPNNKISVTGVRGEPWHYRYVGAEAAQEIMEKGITLEEYLGAAPSK